MAKNYGKKANHRKHGHRAQLNRPLLERKKTTSDQSRVGEKKKIPPVSLALGYKGLSLVLAGTTRAGVGLFWIRRWKFFAYAAYVHPRKNRLQTL